MLEWQFAAMVQDPQWLNMYVQRINAMIRAEVMPPESRELPEYRDLQGGPDEEQMPDREDNSPGKIPHL